MAAEQPEPLALWIGRGAGGMRLVLEYGLKLPTTVVTIVNDFEFRTVLCGDCVVKQGWDTIVQIPDSE